MQIDKKIQKNNYFEFRNVEIKQYKDTILPVWIKNEILNKDLKILDYGCGFGQTLQALARGGYKNIFGVDIEKNAIEYCTANSLDVRELNLDNLQNPFGFKFDIIILSHVIEHIPKEEIINKLSFIKNDFLVENGKLLIAVPNAQSNTDSYWAYEDWTHTTLFTSGSIYYVLKAVGFNNIKFIDIDCTIVSSTIKRIIKKLLLKVYVLNKTFWNRVTCSSYHKPSPQIFSFEIKVKAS